MGRRLGELLTQKGVKQADFARQIGERRQRVNAWITGATEISSDAVPALADKLGVTICELYGVEEGHRTVGAGSGKTTQLLQRFTEALERSEGRIDLIVMSGIAGGVPLMAEAKTSAGSDTPPADFEPGQSAESEDFRPSSAMVAWRSLIARLPSLPEELQTDLLAAAEQLRRTRNQEARS